MLLGHCAWNTFLLSALLVVLGYILSRLVGGTSFLTAAVAIFIVLETVRRSRATASEDMHVEGRAMPRIRGMLPGNLDVLWRWALLKGLRWPT